MSDSVRPHRWQPTRQEHWSVLPFPSLGHPLVHINEVSFMYSWEGPWRKKWQPTPVFLPRESHGQRSLVGYSPWGCKESDTTERLILDFLLRTPKGVYSGDEGFFFTPRTGRQKVAFSPGCVTWAFLKYNPIGLMNLSYLGGFRVKPSPTKQTLVTILFQAFFFLFPVRITFNTSVSPWARTLGRGTSHFP